MKRGLSFKPGGSTSSFSYPCASMAACLALIYLSPFVSPFLNYAAFAICLYRVVRYDISVFAVDYCLLASVSYIFLTTGRVSMLAWLSIAAALWFIFKVGVRKGGALVLLVVLLAYMLLRMQMELNTLVLCFSQLLLLYVLIAGQEKGGMALSALAFCGGMIASSFYALAFRGSWQLENLLGEEFAAYWGSSLTRFQGLFRDPNYYMAMVAFAIALLVFLYLNKYVSGGLFVAGLGCLILFGALTCSKTFVVFLAAYAVAVVIMLFGRKRFVLGVGSLMLFAVMAALLSDTLLSVTMYRIESADNLYDLTTGRSDLAASYIEEIAKSIDSLLFGAGLSAEILRRGTHNLFLEIVFYFGLVGLLLEVAYVIALLRMAKCRFMDHDGGSSGVFRYAVLAVFVLLFCTLQGMTFVITYVMLYLSIMATVIPRRGRMNVSTGGMGQ